MADREGLMASAQFIPVAEWAKNMFGERRFHRNTLRNWIHAGKIAPRPIKVGKSFFCRPDARFVDPVADRINRMINGS
jgi:predicted site-specific integrase-resolvase